MRMDCARWTGRATWLALVLFGSIGTRELAAQGPAFRVPEAPGLTVAGDFDGDGCDDVLILGVSGMARTYLGRKQKPFLRAGPDWQHDGLWSLADVPCFVGEHLYVPIEPHPRSRAVRVYRLERGVWHLKRVIPLPPSSPIYPVNSVRVTALHKDVDNDGKNDAFVAWGETPVTSWGGFHAGYLSPSGLSKRTLLKPLPGQHIHSVVVDVHRSRSLIRPSAPEYLVVMSAPTDQPTGGFGFRIVADGPKPGAGQWATNGPPIAHGKALHTSSGVAYGDSRILPTAKAPLVQLITGESVLFQPWVQAPYVNRLGQLLPTRRLGRWLSDCTADFDGDGREEAVHIEDPLGSGFTTDILVGDPAHRRAWSQHFHLIPHGRTTSVFHGAAGDFDGDGDPDLLLSLICDNHPRNGAFALFRTDRARGPGKPCLQREY